MLTQDLENKNLKRNIRPFVMGFLLIIGCLQMFGDLIGVSQIKAVGAVTSASPAPKVFTAQDGFETFSANFFLEWTDNKQVKKSMHITSPIYYRGVKGPYNRRNAYGAALSYGPVLYKNEITRPMFQSVFEYALCGKAPILHDVGVDPETIEGPIRVRIVPGQALPQDHDWKLIHEITCP